MKARSPRQGPRSQVPAVVVGCYTMGLGVIRSLGRRGIPVIAVHFDRSDMGHRSKYVTRRISVPHPEAEPSTFISRMIDLGDVLSKPVLLPAADSALTTISHHHEELSHWFRVGCGDWTSARCFIDKQETYRLAQTAGVPTPLTATPSDERQVLEYAESAHYPVLVKPSQSHTYVRALGRKMTRVHDTEGLVSAYREAQHAGLDVMLQEIIPGPDTMGVNYNSFSVNGRVLVEFTARKLRGSPRGFGSPCALVSAHVPDVARSGRAIIEAMGIDGFACTEFKLDARDGTYKLMEVNGRHNLSSLLAVECGIDFPNIHYEYLAHDEVPQPLEFRDDVYWIDIFRDIASSASAMREGALSIADFLRPYRREHVFAIASITDPLPFALRARDLMRRYAMNPH